MALVVLAWLYVALMMAVAEATNSNGTVLGAVFTFLMYGAGPIALVSYLLGRPARRARRLAREREEAARAASAEPDRGGEAPAGAVPTVRKEP